eukprot:1153229-Pelagomonas_calceolata.AAC.12
MHDWAAEYDCKLCALNPEQQVPWQTAGSESAQVRDAAQSSASSDTHLYLALEWLERAGKKYGSGHEKTKTASQACLAAHLMRYGRVPNELLSQLIMARSQVG